MNYGRWKVLRRFASDDAGVTSIEYGMIGLVVAVGIVGSLSLIAPELNTIFLAVAAAFVAALAA